MRRVTLEYVDDERGPDGECYVWHIVRGERVKRVVGNDRRLTGDDAMWEARYLAWEAGVPLFVSDGCHETFRFLELEMCT